MKNILLATALTLGASAASAATIDFEGYAIGTGYTGFTDGIATITPLLHSGDFAAEIDLDTHEVGQSLWLYNDTDDDNEIAGNPSQARVDFAVAVASVSVDLGDLAQDQDNVFLAIYDANDLMLDYIEFLSDADSIDMMTLALSSTSTIAYALFGTNGYDMGAISVDNLSYDVAAVPVPAGGLLLASALGLLGLKRRRRAA